MQSKARGKPLEWRRSSCRLPFWREVSARKKKVKLKGREWPRMQDRKESVSGMFERSKRSRMASEH